MSARDELQAVIYGYFGPPSQIKPYKKSPVEQDRELAETILAKGYRKPRAITTVEELDALPEGSAILCSDRGVWVNDGDTVAPWASLGEGNSEGGPIWVHSVDINLPATVLHEPEAEVGA